MDMGVGEFGHCEAVDLSGLTGLSEKLLRMFLSYFTW